MAAVHRNILAASFGSRDGASRAAMSVLGAYRAKIANTAVIVVKPDGTPQFTETKDWGPGRGALLGGAIGLIGGPLGVLAGGGIGALATKLRDRGFDNGQLAELGESLRLDESVVLFEIAADAAAPAAELLRALSAQRVVIEPIDASVAALFDSDPELYVVSEATV